LRVINSHSHYDHVGGNHQFERILSPATPFSRTMAAGLRSAELAQEVSPAALCRELPAGVAPDTHRIRPYRITGTLTDGETIDLGGRVLEVLFVPGHTPDAVALLDRRDGYLWSGDSFYAGPIWLFAPETDLPAYRRSVHRLADLVPGLTAVFPAHNTPRADPALLRDLAQAVDAVLAGAVTGKTVGEDQVEFSFAGFSLLLRADLLP
jgi:glyoxylase-like metal-dependent hydrolase (beta-lactamase superfamily II)